MIRFISLHVGEIHEFTEDLIQYLEQGMANFFYKD